MPGVGRAVGSRGSVQSRHRLTTQTSKRGFDNTYTYGFHGRATRVDRADLTSNLFAAAEVVGLIDSSAAGGTLGSAGNPALLTRPSEVEATYTDGNGNATTYGVNRFGSATSVENALTETNTTRYDANGLSTQRTGKNGRIDSFTRDAVGNILTRTEAVGDPLQRTTTFEYEPIFNKVTKITDPALGITLFDYDANGNLLKRTDALLGERVLTYNALGLIETRSDENLNLTTFVYDAKGNLETVIDALSNETLFTRDAAGNVISVTEANGTPEARTSSLAYDVMNRFTSGTNAAGDPPVLQRYDAVGNLIETESPTGEISFFTYDTRDRQDSIDDPVSGLTAFDHDGNGNIIQVVDALGGETLRFYDLLDRIEREVDPNLGETLFTYDTAGNLASVTDPELKTTSFDYDLFDRRTQRSNALTETVTFAWDNRDNLAGTLDPAGREIVRSYDALSRLTTIELRPSAGGPADDVITLSYDAAGNLTGAVDGDSELSFGYDALNRRATATTGSAGLLPSITLTGGFDAFGQRTALTDSLGGTTGYGYDLAGRLTSIDLDPTTAIALAYDVAGRLKRIDYPSGVIGEATYDPDGRLVDLSHKLGVTDLTAYAYGHDALGQITSIAEPGRNLAFTYDPVRQVIAAGTTLTPETYAYDLVGNRTTSHLSTGHLVDDANRLLEDDAFCYGYSLAGNRTNKTQKVAGACTGAVTSYGYDIQNRLVRIDLPGGGIADYAYDALGRRIQKDVDGLVTKYLYDDEDIYLEFDGADVLQARTTHGPQRDQPLAVERGGQTYYYHGDHRGSVRLITDAVGSVVNAYDYDAYGNFVAQSETLPNTRTYTGREYDAESGLYHYRARAYDPVTGQFLQDDPLGFGGGDLNLSRYVGNNPINFRDPGGLFAPGYVIVKAVEAFFTLVAALIVKTTDLDGPDATENDEPEPDPDSADDGNNQCPPKDENGDDCEKLYEQINRVVNNLQRRYRQLREDMGKLPLEGPKSIATHREQFSDRARGLRRLLNQANSKGCVGYRSDAWYWATTEPPYPAGKQPK